MITKVDLFLLGVFFPFRKERRQRITDSQAELDAATTSTFDRAMIELDAGPLTRSEVSYENQGRTFSVR